MVRIKERIGIAAALVLALLLTNTFVQRSFNGKSVAPGNPKTQFFLHVGPMKTATTTIQTSFEKNTDLLYNLSSYVYMGKLSSGGACRRPNDDTVAYCVDPESFALYATPYSAKEFENAAGALRRNGVGAVVSMEELSLGIINPDHDLLFGSLSGLLKDWNVTLSLTYRRYFEWILSSYNQIEKHRLNYKWPRRRIRRSRRRIRRSGSINTGIDRATTCTFGRWFDGLHRNSGGGDENNKSTACNYRWIRSFDPSFHPVEYIIKKFREKLDCISIKVFNMHQEGDLFTNFVCQVMPGAENFCRALLTGGGREESQQRPMNPSKMFDYDRLALAAYRKGLLTPSSSLSLSRKALRESLQVAFPDLDSVSGFKYLCPPIDEMERLLELSVRYEKEIYRKYLLPPSSRNATLREKYLEGVEADHRKSFENYIESRTFCNW
eukprot:CAMPEP_0194281306 /NCGR_PEP_ID=MMETSP0169-20130528/20448_1 /TAXON_ID=218684 /ORGANISM="Corethron pennatum, Strain L29A3" /LENGTH=436 /DNA_ID=CAMNT_0039026327 /DNA_START=341 /DNA_END=1648 /DNA_ORIENTATION=-